MTGIDNAVISDMWMFGKIFTVSALVVFCLLFITVAVLSGVIHSNDDLKPQLSQHYQDALSNIQATVDIPLPIEAVISVFCGFVSCHIYATRRFEKPTAVEGGKP